MIVVIDGTRTYRIDQGQRNTVTTTAGVIYCVAHDTSATEYFRCWKSTDYGESWTLVASYLLGTFESAPSIDIDSSDLIHICFWKNTSQASGGGLKYMTLNTSTDTLSGVSTIAGSSSTLGITQPQTCCAIDSSGNFHVAYADEISSRGPAFLRTYYARRDSSAGTWARRLIGDGYIPNSIMIQGCSGILGVSSGEIPIVARTTRVVAGTPLITNIILSLGNSNSPTKFTNKTLTNVSSTPMANHAQLVDDAKGNLFLFYRNSILNVAVAKLSEGSVWSTWSVVESTSVSCSDVVGHSRGTGSLSNETLFVRINTSAGVDLYSSLLTHEDSDEDWNEIRTDGTSLTYENIRSSWSSCSLPRGKKRGNAEFTIAGPSSGLRYLRFSLDQFESVL